METLISKATKRNWARLGTEGNARLTKRANKRESKKRILPVEYFTNRGNVKFVQQFIDRCEARSWEVERVLFSIAVNLLQQKHILSKAHVRSVLGEYCVDVIPEIVNLDIPSDEWDLLGLIYQGMLREGEKNLKGSYYTPREIASGMTRDFDFLSRQTFLDPCCGSGSFLLTLSGALPEQVFGFDNDPVAVMIAKFNMLLKYCGHVFSPQIFCLDYLGAEDLATSCEARLRTFDYIATNPPWGAVSGDEKLPMNTTAKESFSCFFVRAFAQLKKEGQVRFLFPEAILNVKTHKDIRKFMLDNCCIKQITFYNKTFSGVTTKYVDILCQKGEPSPTLLLKGQEGRRRIRTANFRETENCVFGRFLAEDWGIIQRIRTMGCYDLSRSAWALGIVTGDNKRKVKSVRERGYEPIFTGKEITRYVLKPVRNYLLYDRSQLQQVAREELYRAEEKLVYKFISNKLVFAYDNSKSLFLNSANILIPDIPRMGIKTVMAFLNSEVFQYFYLQMFGEIKILKGNLIKLPFPEVSETQNRCFEGIVDKILDGNGEQDKILQEIIYALYDFSERQILHVKRRLHSWNS